MVPTWGRTRGVTGHRPVVGIWDGKPRLYVFASVNVTSCALPTDPGESRTGQSKSRRLQRAFAAPRRRLGRRSPQDKYPRGVVRIDNAPWQAGEPVQRALADNPHVALQRLPS